MGEYEYATLESMEFEEKFELKNRERFYIENNTCVNIRVPNRTNKEWYEENREILSEKKKIYAKANKEKFDDYNKKYQEENKEKIREQKKIYQEENREKFDAYDKKYQEENKEKIAAYRKKYREKNREKLNAKSKIYREKKRQEKMLKVT